MSTLITATFTGERDLQAALRDLRALGIPPESVHTITVPPERPDADADELEIRDQPPLDAAGGAAAFGPTAAAGLAQLGIAPGGPLGEVLGPDYPSGSLPVTEAPASVLDQAVDQLRQLGLSVPDRERYRQRLQAGDAVLAVQLEAGRA